MIRLVTINGSPDPTGNTAALLTHIGRTAQAWGAEIQHLHAADLLEKSGSIFCHVCGNPCTGICYKGTPLEQAFQILAAADAIVLGSPVYFGTAAAPLKAFFDKTRKLRSEKALCNTIGAGVAVGAARFGGQETTVRALHDIMLVHGMMVVGDGHAEHDCGHQGVCGQRPAGEDTWALGRSEILAKRICQVAQATQALRTA